MKNNSQIQILDELTANQIAAGEVVERPANAVKEMIENSLDAGASKIKIEVRGGGRKLLRISDNGKGMGPEDLSLSILRHATSKLRKIDDLDQLHSLGFRGEALASIAAVSNLTLTSRTDGEELGHLLEVRGGQTLRNEPCGSEIGTMIQVEELFFNMPAREKFMKADSAEHRAISEMITRFALARPDVSFALEVEGKRNLFTQGAITLKQAAGSLFGGEVESNLLLVNRIAPEGEVKGLVGKPTLIKSTRSHQFFFINGRWIQSRMLSQAVEQAYESMMPKKGFAFVILQIELDPSTLDVNIHPQKTEIRFRNERDLFRLVRRAIQDALSAGSALPESREVSHGSLGYETSKEFPFLFKESVSEYNSSNSFKNGTSSIEAVWERVQSDTNKTDSDDYLDPNILAEKNEFLNTPNKIVTLAKDDASNENQLLDRNLWEDPPLIKDSWEIEPLGQVGETYIIARTPNELIMIDQHAAHERILFDRLLSKKAREESQLLLTDQIFNFEEEAVETLLTRADEFIELGWKFSAAGPGMLRIEESPIFLGEKEVEEFIRLMVRQVLENPNGEISNYVLHSLGHMRACKTALKANQVLHMKEISSLLDQLKKTENPYTCPHGRPVVIRLTTSDLAKMFKRT